MKNKTKYHVLGLMSGTSLDGLDITHCTYLLKDGQWRYSCNASITISYTQNILDQLKSVTQLTSEELLLLDIELGRWMGEQSAVFIEDHGLLTDFISSHGHTVFHQPERSLTLQIGNGVQIQLASKLPVVYDFRSLDVALGGQGAPLVPIGDQLLFAAYEMCLNLGGIANISHENSGQRVAHDIVPCNMVLNHLANKMNLSYDENGNIAKEGSINNELLKALNSWEYYKRQAPKSLGYEMISAQVISLLDQSPLSVPDLLATFCEHIAQQIAESLKGKNGRLLITGGGAFNSYLIERLKSKTQKNIQVVVPEPSLISFKEAIVFGFLGVLRQRNEINCLSSVTGASRDSSSGVIYE